MASSSWPGHDSKTPSLKKMKRYAPGACDPRGRHGCTFQIERIGNDPWVSNARLGRLLLGGLVQGRHSWWNQQWLQRHRRVKGQKVCVCVCFCVSMCVCVFTCYRKRQSSQERWDYKMCTWVHHMSDGDTKMNKTWRKYFWMMHAGDCFCF